MKALNENEVDSFIHSYKFNANVSLFFVVTMTVELVLFDSKFEIVMKNKS